MIGRRSSRGPKAREVRLIAIPDVVNMHSKQFQLQPQIPTEGLIRSIPCNRILTVDSGLWALVYVHDTPCISVSHFHRSYFGGITLKTLKQTPTSGLARGNNRRNLPTTTSECSARSLQLSNLFRREEQSFNIPSHVTHFIASTVAACRRVENHSIACRLHGCEY